MIRIFKLTVTRRDEGYSLEHDALYFTDDQVHEQCDRHGNILSDPLFTLNRSEQTIVELVNPEVLGTAQHATHKIIVEIKFLGDAWINALASPQTIFTRLPISYFSDQFHRETLV